MNRQGPGLPSSMRGGGLPNQFAAQPQHGTRGVPNRMPIGKQGGSPGWALGGVQIGSPGMSAMRQQQQHLFPERMVGSGSATPLDLSEFPTLGSNTTMNNPNGANMWSGSRNPPGQMPRNQPTPLQSSQAPQDDIYTPASSRLGAQGVFRFGGMQQQQQQQPQQQQPQDPQLQQHNHNGGIEDFPPLNKNVAGDFGQERSSNLMSLGFNAQQGAGSRAGGGTGVSNGLLSAVSAIHARMGEPRTASALGAPGSSRSQATRTQADGDPRQKNGLRDETQSVRYTESDSPAQGSNPLGAIGNDVSSGRSKNREDRDRLPDPVDPLAGMSELDKWGLKGLRTLMSNYPDYNAMATGIDPAELGLDLNTTEMISKQQWSVFEADPPRPVVTKFRLPDCYKVSNVAPLQGKITSFADDTLFYVFYSCPRDLRQEWAATELFARNWRWNRKLRTWLTKDEHTGAQSFGTYERGIYIVWDPKLWRRDRRELVVYYADLDSSTKTAL